MMCTTGLHVTSDLFHTLRLKFWKSTSSNLFLPPANFSWIHPVFNAYFLSLVDMVSFLFILQTKKLNSL